MIDRSLAILILERAAFWHDARLLDNTYKKSDCPPGCVACYIQGELRRIAGKEE